MSFQRMTMTITSLPSRERGLKFSFAGMFILGGMSLPSRERGLK